MPKNSKASQFLCFRTVIKRHVPAKDVVCGTYSYDQSDPIGLYGYLDVVCTWLDYKISNLGLLSKSTLCVEHCTSNLGSLPWMWVAIQKDVMLSSIG